MFDANFNASEPMNADFDDGQELTADFSDTIAVTDLDYNHLENHPSIEGHELVGDSTLEDIGVVIPEVPTKVSELENDVHYATVSQLPTVPTNVSAFTNDANYATTSQIPTVPTVISAFTNDAGYITSSDIPTKTSDLDNDSGFITSGDIPAIPSATSDLENDSGFITENDIPAIPSKTSDLENDSDFTTSADVTAALAGKVDKETGKGLSTNDYTTEEQSKLAGIEAGAEVNPTAVSELTNDAGYVTANDSVAGLNVVKLTNENLNDLKPTVTTFYYADPGNTCTNTPTQGMFANDEFGLLVIRIAASEWMQFFFSDITAIRTAARVYNGSWASWQNFNHPYSAGQSWSGLMSATDKKKLDQLSASTLNVKDTSGLCGTAGATVTIQALMDAIAARV